MRMTRLKLYYSQWGNGSLRHDNSSPVKAALVAGTKLSIPRNWWEPLRARI
jgi:hypothetical protein